MGCGNYVSGKNMAQMSAAWTPVPSDKRYEEKVVQYTSGRITRMTRVAGQTTEYPHHTEYYSSTGAKETSRTHYSTARGSRGSHTDAHRTGQSVIDDLVEAISSLRSSR
jgi:hypothetical protein